MRKIGQFVVGLTAMYTWLFVACAGSALALFWPSYHPLAAWFLNGMLFWAMGGWVQVNFTGKVRERLSRRQLFQSNGARVLLHGLEFILIGLLISGVLLLLERNPNDTPIVTDYFLVHGFAATAWLYLVNYFADRLSKLLPGNGGENKDKPTS